jgi:hypothetical protein
MDSRNFISVKFREWDLDRVREIISECGGEDSGFYVPPIRVAKVFIPHDAKTSEVLAAFRSHPEVERATMTGYVRLAGNYHSGVSDTLVDSQWHLKRINVFRAWRHTQGDPSVKVVIVDTGYMTFPQGVEDDQLGAVDPSLEWNVETGTASGVDTYPDDGEGGFYSHGTAVLSCIRPNTNNAQGIAGVAPGVSAGMVVNHWINGWDGDAAIALDVLEAAAAIVKAKDLGANVINCSFGGPRNRDGYPLSSEAWNDVDDAVEYAYLGGTLVVFAAGNYWADLGVVEDISETPFAICVGGTADASDAWWNEGNYGSPVDITAPSEGILAFGCEAGNPEASEYFPVRGTSFAAPIVSAVAGLVLSINPNLSVDEVVALLKATADAGRHSTFATHFPNAGVVNAAKAILSALATLPANQGVVYPYVNFYGAGATVTADPTTSSVRTTLNGAINVEIGGYSSDQIESVELWVSGVKRYDGAPTTFSCNAVYSEGAGVPVKVVARTASASTEETYDDILLTSIDLPVMAPPVVVSGGGDIIATGIVGTIGAVVAAIPLLVGAVSAQHSVKAALSGSIPAVVASVEGIRGQTGFVSGTLPAFTGAIQGVRVGQGSIAGTLSSPFASVQGDVPTAARIVGTLPSAYGNVSVAVGRQGILDGTLPVLEGSLAGDATAIGEIIGTLGGVLPSIQAQFDDSGMWFATIGGTLSSPAGEFLSDVGASFGIQATLPVVSGSMNGAFAVLALATGTLPSPTGDVQATCGEVASFVGTLPSIEFTAYGTSYAPGEIDASMAGTLPSATGLIYSEADIAGFLSGALPSLMIEVHGEIVYVEPETLDIDIHLGLLTRRIEIGVLSKRCEIGSISRRVNLVCDGEEPNVAEG